MPSSQTLNAASIRNLTAPKRGSLLSQPVSLKPNNNTEYNPSVLKTPSKHKSFDLLSSPTLGASAFSPGSRSTLPNASQQTPSSSAETKSQSNGLEQVPDQIITLPDKETQQKHIQSFLSRANKQSNVLTFNTHIPLPTATISRTLVSLIEGQQTAGYRYMYEKITEKGDLLDMQITRAATLIAESWDDETNLMKVDKNEMDIVKKETIDVKIESNDMEVDDDDSKNIKVKTESELEMDRFSLFAHPSMISQEVKLYIGRICCDSVVDESKINQFSVVLESCKEIGTGARSKLDFNSYLQKGLPMALFPGQLVCLEASNPTGNLLVVSKIVHLPQLPIPTTTCSELVEYYPPGQELPVSMVITCGPYTLLDSLEYEPLEDLVQALLETGVPDVLLMMGPFVDCDHPFIQTGNIEMDVFEIFKLHITNRLIQLKRVKPSMEIILIPSQRDACMEWIAFPQPPLGSGITDNDRMEKLTLLGLLTSNGEFLAQLFPNPTQFTINELLIATTSLDTLVALGNNFIYHCGDQKRDRVREMFQQILTQRHFYPIFPPLPGACLDSTRALSTNPTDPCVLQLLPDMMIVPSLLAPCVKEVGSTLCINPGLLTKGRVGGTYCRVTVHPLLTEAMTDGDSYPHGLLDRTRVDIIRL
ncbi:DNA polymerase alpha/epsilon subunit B-domain-containing protein [Globomyces pollinis-pini]|nr:DNA polymerase alpha/epsilon subunit B-domain-containing protein [Globomyces pollinis-pini]